MAESAKMSCTERPYVFKFANLVLEMRRFCEKGSVCELVAQIVHFTAQTTPFVVHGVVCAAISTECESNVNQVGADQEQMNYRLHAEIGIVLSWL